MLAEEVPLVWQAESFGDKVEVLPRKPLLHFANIDREPILSGELATRGEVVNLLVLIQSLVEIVLSLGVRPEHVPVVAVCRDQVVDLEEEADQFGLALQHLVVDCGLANLRVVVRSTGC